MNDVETLWRAWDEVSHELLTPEEAEVQCGAAGDDEDGLNDLVVPPLLHGADNGLVFDDNSGLDEEEHPDEDAKDDHDSAIEPRSKRPRP